jgi:hypothetical protein
MPKAYFQSFKFLGQEVKPGKIVAFLDFFLKVTKNRKILINH